MTDEIFNLVGKTVDNKYLIEEWVGSGGFAEVYRATHLAWNRPVAIKVFKLSGQAEESLRSMLLAQFHQEGPLLAELSEHTSAIVQARDTGLIELEGGHEVPFMILEWLSGLNLEDYLEQRKLEGLAPYSVFESVAMMGPIFHALGLAHKRGIVHRDIKPANVFVVQKDGGVSMLKLLDFGIAKFAFQNMGSSSYFSEPFTIQYGAPEQFSNLYGATGPWTDVYGMALLLIEMMTGEDPQLGQDFVQISLVATNLEQRPSPRAFGLTVSDQIESIFLKALAVDPEKRFQDCAKFYEALVDAFEGQDGHSTDVMTGVSAIDEPGSFRDLTEEGKLNSRSARGGVFAQTAPFNVATLPPSVPKARRLTFVAGAMGLVVLSGLIFYVAGRKKSEAKKPVVLEERAKPNGSSGPDTVGIKVVDTVTPACLDGMVAIPGGFFFMGADTQLIKKPDSKELPRHQVRLDSYCIDKFEVTVQKYVACSGSGRCERAGIANVWDGITANDEKIFNPICSLYGQKQASEIPNGRAELPINCINWEKASRYCESVGGRLPTEAEWEFAARGAEGNVYPWGDEEPNELFLNACGAECIKWGSKQRGVYVPQRSMYPGEDAYVHLAPVGAFPRGASRYGIMDVAGNVYEWVADFYASYESNESVLENPRGPSKGESRVMRGGAWNSEQAKWMRPSFRYAADPNLQSHGVGFRCAGDLKKSKI